MMGRGVTSNRVVMLSLAGKGDAALYDLSDPLNARVSFHIDNFDSC